MQKQNTTGQLELRQQKSRAEPTNNHTEQQSTLNCHYSKRCGIETLWKKIKKIGMKTEKPEKYGCLLERTLTLPPYACTSEGMGWCTFWIF